MTERVGFHGLEIELRVLPGARALRVVHPGRQEIEEHRHDWPVIAVYALGKYRECYDGGEADIAAPSVAIHPACRPHADLIRTGGLETLNIEFDPAWMRANGFDLCLDRSQIWQGGQVTLAARQLASDWSDPEATEPRLAKLTCEFLHMALVEQPMARPPWLCRVERDLDVSRPRSTIEIARRLDLHPAWLARAYRLAKGEGMHETVRRRRVERASSMLRRTDWPAAEIAVAAGFCDQSHMNRAFLALNGRSPVAVRSERSLSLPTSPLNVPPLR